MVALVAAGCGGNNEPAPARPIRQGAVTTTSGAGGAGAPEPLSPGPLEPGAYRTVDFRPALSLRVGKDWGLLGDAENGIALAPKFDPATGPEK
jgi:hypothetical protein